MLHCKDCGLRIDKDANFCPKCGAVIAKQKKDSEKKVKAPLYDEANNNFLKLDKLAIAFKAVLALGFFLCILNFFFISSESIIFSVLWRVFTITYLALYCNWFYRLIKNKDEYIAHCDLYDLYKGEEQVNPKWAILSIFVPIVNLYRPYSALEQCYFVFNKASCNSKASRLIDISWCSTCLCLVVLPYHSLFYGIKSFFDGFLDTFLIVYPYELYMVLIILWLITTILMFMLVDKMTKLQNDAISELDSSYVDKELIKHSQKSKLHIAILVITTCATFPCMFKYINESSNALTLQGNAFYFVEEQGEKAKKGFEQYKKAAEKGNVDAFANLACAYLNGAGVTQDKTKAFEYFKKAADKGHAFSQYALADLYFRGNGVEKDLGKTIEYLKKAEIQNLPEAQCALGDLYMDGKGVEKDLNKAIQYYKKAADQGYAEAQNTLGDLYRRGEGVNRYSVKDRSKAFEYYKKAADQGYPEAQTNLGYSYLMGNGTRIDEEKAFEYFKRAADQGFAGAQRILGDLYSRGDATASDCEKAVEYYKQAAEQGMPEAQYKLGNLYFAGRGTDKDLNKAFDLCKKAADQGFVDAQYALGNLYLLGDGTKIDKNKAFEYFKQAAKQGKPEAQYQLGLCYLNGDGVEKNRTEAMKWIEKVADQGFKMAIEKLEEIKKEETE